MARSWSGPAPPRSSRRSWRPPTKSLSGCSKSTACPARRHSPTSRRPVRKTRWVDYNDCGEPMNPEEHYDRALDAFAGGDLETAVAEYQKALELNPAYTDALHGLAQAYAQQGKLDDAIAAACRIA